MKVLLPKDLLKKAHHFPPYHIGSSLGTARFWGDYRFIGFLRRRIPPKTAKRLFPKNGKSRFFIFRRNYFAQFAFKVARFSRISLGSLSPKLSS